MTFKWSVLAAACGQTAWLAGTAILAFATVDDPAPYVVAYGMGTVVNGTLSYLWARRRVAIRFDAGRAALRRLWTASWPAGVSMAMASVYFFIDTAMLRPLRGEVDTAHYSAAYRIMTFVLMVPVLFSQVIFPVFSRLWPRGPDALLPFFRRSLGFLFALGIMVPATVPLLRREVMALVYPPGYQAGAPALGVLCLAVGAVFAAYPHVLLLLAAGRQRVMMVISTLAALLNIGANLLLIPRWGPLGAAWTTVGTELFVLLGAAVMGWRLTGVRVAPASLLRPLVCATGAWALLAALLPVLPGSPLVRIVVGVAVALAAVLATGVLPLDLGTEEGAPEGE
jgi:O-antigen/teichoic acid export membrane protein